MGELDWVFFLVGRMEGGGLGGWRGGDGGGER